MTKISLTDKNSANKSGVYVLSAISISRIDKISAKKSADYVLSAINTFTTNRRKDKIYFTQSQTGKIKRFEVESGVTKVFIQ